MKDRLSSGLRIVLTVVLAALLPGILNLLLQAQISWLLLSLLISVKIALFYLSRRLRGAWGWIFCILSILFGAGAAAVVLTGILITPYSAYGIWFESVREGDPRGVVSVLMVLLAALFSATLAQRALHGDLVLPIYGQLLIAAGILALIYQNRTVYLVLLGLLALGTLILSLFFVEPPHRLRNFSVFLLIFLALLALCRLPLLVAKPGGSRIVDEQLHPGLRQAVVTLFPRFPLLYGIPGFGYGFDTGHLGGKPILTEAPIFEIQGQPGGRFYLRTSAYTIYDGQSWSKAREVEKSSDPPEAGKIQALTPDRTPSTALRITLLAEYYTLLPFTLNTQTILLPAEQLEGLTGSFEGGYQLENPLRSQQSIYLLLGRPSGDPQRSLPGLSTEDRERHLRLPGRISPELAELAAFLKDPAGDTRKTLRNIENYLARNYTYNLEAKRTPAGTEFVYNFLFSIREGFCVHFATAFTVLARLNGIPSRYATGFLVHLPDGSIFHEASNLPGLGTVSGLSAHAWPEVWLKDRGWTAWEATTAVNPSYYEEMEGDLLYEYNREDNRMTNRQLRAILGREPATREQAARLFRSINWQYLLLVIPVFALLLVLLGATRRFGILILAALQPDHGSALKVIGRIASSLDHDDEDSPEKLGWTSWIRLAASRSPRLESSLARLLVVIQRLVYSDHGFRRLDLRFLAAFYRKYCATPRLNS